MTAINSSYKPHKSGDCALLDSDPRHPCWGQVEIVDCFEREGGGEAVCILACQGHFDKIKYGWVAKYLGEKK